ncbi:MAG TPA: chemotaxis protein CheA [Rhizomicrobium sp.]|jgi:two-component system chemotaxis sensor kinase CheA
MNEFIEQFLLESRELVDQATADLLAIEENPGDAERLDSAFRAFHTLKGSAGIVDFAAMVKAAHAAEDVLAAVRAGNAPVSRGMIGNCLSCLDLILQWLDAMQVDGEIPAGAEEAASAMVKRFGPNDSGSGDAKSATSEPINDSSTTSFLPPAATTLLQAQLELLREKASDGLVGRILSAGRVAVNVLRSIGVAEGVADIEQAAGASAAAEDGTLLAKAIQRFLPKAAAEFVTGDAGHAPEAAAARVLRVDVERIDALVKLTGELIVAKNAVGHAAQLARTEADPKIIAQVLKDQHAVLGRLVDELQRSVLTIRVLPLRHVFNRFPKLVREIAEALGKPAKLITEGDDTEADKVVVESIFEPLLHIIRNALDHGVETPSERAASGKPQTATITLRASRNADVVLVEVQDDGRGVDLEKVRLQAQIRQIADAEAIARMTDEEVVDLVFAPGFSTAATVSDLSGRGVGMDIVRSSVERLGGIARIASTLGQGTLVTLRLPFSVMMTRVMTVQAGNQMFGLPLESVIETVRLPHSGISEIGKGQAFVLRSRIVPLIDLAQCLGHATASTHDSDANIVIVSAGGQTFGLQVGRFGDRLDVMLKPMDGILQGMSGVAGTSLLSDGSVLIVLDPQDLVR